MAKILIVDDEPTIVDILSTLLRLNGHTPVGAHSVNQALDQLASERPDAILLDIMLPDGNGLDLCKQLRKMAKWIALPIIVHSASAPARQAEAKAAGADGYLTKPIRREALADALGAVNII